MTKPSPELPVPLTTLTDDEILFRDSVRQFADREIAPLVREMDEHGAIPRHLIGQLFDLGVMGIEIPDQFGGSGARFFHAALAVEVTPRSIRLSAFSSMSTIRS